MGQTTEDMAALHEGFPPWMERSVWEWISSRVTYSFLGSSTFYRTELIEEYERLTRARAPISDEFARYGMQMLKNRWSQDELLRFLDFLVSKDDSQMAESVKARALEKVLVDSGSAWCVGTRDGHPGLERRVPLGVQEAAEAAIGGSGHAGQRLSEAWHAAFGVSPDPSKAYSLAIKAVEDAAKHEVSPNDAQATLGKMNNVMRDQGWTLPLQRDDQKFSSTDVLQAMSRALWAGQVDRHGGTDTPSSTPVAITQEAAETAVLLAVPLVHWLSSGAAARR